MRTLFLAIALATLVATAASATAPPVVWFAEDFEDQAGFATRNGVKLCADPVGIWTGDNGSKEALKFVAGSGVGGSQGLRSRSMAAGTGQWAWNANLPFAGTDVETQITHIMVRGNPGSGDLGYHTSIWMDDQVGNEMGRWYGYSTTMTARYDGHISPTNVDLSDWAWHDLDMVYSKSTGDMTWYADGALFWTYNVGAGMAVGDINFNGVIRSTSVYDDVVMDDLVVGTVPEPSSLLALGAFGLGMLGCINRRRQ